VFAVKNLSWQAFQNQTKFMVNKVFMNGYNWLIQFVANKKKPATEDAGSK
jgi:hypothetical protein